MIQTINPQLLSWLKRKWITYIWTDWTSPNLTLMKKSLVFHQSQRKTVVASRSQPSRRDLCRKSTWICLLISRVGIIKRPLLRNQILWTYSTHWEVTKMNSMRKCSVLSAKNNNGICYSTHKISRMKKSSSLIIVI